MHCIIVLQTIGRHHQPLEFFPFAGRVRRGVSSVGQWKESPSAYVAHLASEAFRVLPSQDRECLHVAFISVNYS